MENEDQLTSLHGIIISRLSLALRSDVSYTAVCLHRVRISHDSVITTSPARPLSQWAMISLQLPGEKNAENPLKHFVKATTITATTETPAEQTSCLETSRPYSERNLELTPVLIHFHYATPTSTALPPLTHFLLRLDRYGSLVNRGGQTPCTRQID